MIRVGPAGYPEGSKGPVDAVERCAKLGFNALEVQFVRQARMAEDKAIALGKRANELGVLLSVHAPYYINFNSLNPETVRKSGEWVLKSVRLAHLMKAYVVVIHAASYSGGEPSKATRAVLTGLRECQRTMEQEGTEEVLLGLETMGKRGSWGTLAEIAGVSSQLQGVVPVVDFAHLHARSGGSLDSVERFRAVLEEAGSMCNRRLHSHYSCIEFTEAGERRHLTLGERQPDFSLLVRALRGWKGELTIISETPAPENGAREMVVQLSAQRRGKGGR